MALNWVKVVVAIGTAVYEMADEVLRERARRNAAAKAWAETPAPIRACPKCNEIAYTPGQVRCCRCGAAL